MTVLEPVIEYIQGLTRRKVTLEQIVGGAERPRKPVLRVMDRLAKEGYVYEIEDPKEARRYRECGPSRRNPIWKILKKPMIETFTSRPCKNSLRDRMWRVIRAQRRFTRSTLMRLSGVKIGSVTDYTKLLERHGYLRFIGKDSHQKVYMLIKDPGPIRPVTKEVIKDAQ